jgi:urocanate hydratase
VAEHPDQLIVYGGSGRPELGRLRRHRYDTKDPAADDAAGSPEMAAWCGRTRARVLIATAAGAAVGDLGGVPSLTMLARRLTDYIGTQGILQGTYETFAAVGEAARRSLA